MFISVDLLVKCNMPLAAGHFVTGAQQMTAYIYICFILLAYSFAFL